ncbi:MAG TPA: PEGA domain-containing protein [Vicinamibacterales bacterium]|nr:PEGA domain-containing protein [Vicinamibacterales bacterium]
MSDVLVVQPDVMQKQVLRGIFQRIGAELVIVESALEAKDAIAHRMPDLILLSSFLSPRDEDTLIAHLRTLDGASHLQTLTLPQFRGNREAAATKGGFFRKKKPQPAVSAGCDPAVFAEEVVAHLHRAHEVRSRPVVVKPVAPPAAPEPIEAPQPEFSPAAPEPMAFEPFVPEAVVSESTASDASEPSAVDSLFAAPIVQVEEARPAPSLDAQVDDVDRLARELGVDVSSLVEIDEVQPPVGVEAGDTYDFGAALDRARAEADSRRAAELARAEADADAIREAAIAQARAAAEREAREAVAADLARVQAEAEAMRDAALAEAEAMREVAIAEARAAAEKEAREMLDAELARVRSETEVTVADALNKVKVEAKEAERARVEAERLRKAQAEETEHLRKIQAEEAERARVEAERLRVEAQEAFAAELKRVRAEVEQQLAVQLEAARTEAERMRAAEAAAVRDRAAAEAQLKSELDRLRFVATQARKADESETKKAAEQIKQLERELASVHAKAEERQVTQLEELRAQMAEMREAAAQHARTAAAEAVASEVARASAQSSSGTQQKLNVIRMQPRTATPAPVVVVPPVETPAPPAAEVGENLEAQASADYLSLWRPSALAEETVAEESADEAREPVNYRRHAKWALPAAACLILVANTGTAISTLARFAGPGETPPALTVEPAHIEPFSEVVEKRVGRLQVESTPSGAEAIVDGKSYGQTPVTIPNLAVGTHTLSLKSSAGNVTRKITIKANETAIVAEAIFSGWLAIFSPIPVTAVVDGQAVNLTDDGRLMTTPGKHVVELVSERFNYRSTETLNVRPGETTAHTLTLPTGSVRVTAPEGTEIRIDGQPTTGVPAEGLPVVIGSHEITATHAELGERRVQVDVVHGSLTEVTLQFTP